jgi:hypothetical protein
VVAVVKSWMKELWAALCEPGPVTMGMGMGMGFAGSYCHADVAEYLELSHDRSGSLRG